MDILQLLSLAYGGNKQERTDATTELERALQSPDGLLHLVALLRAGTDLTLPPGQSLSALIYAKNYIVHTLDEDLAERTPEVLEEVKSLIYNGAFQVQPTHQSIICVCATTIINAFKWDYLPQLMQEITRSRAEVPVEHALASLKLLYAFIKRFKTSARSLMQVNLEMLSCLVAVLPPFLSYGDLRVDHMVFKAMECIVEAALNWKDAYHVPPDAFDVWFQEMIQHPERHFSAACEASTKGSPEVYDAYLHCLKRIAVISHSVMKNAIQKKSSSPVAKHFLKKNASAFFGLWRKWLEYAVKFTARDAHHKVDALAIRYIKLCTLDRTLYQQYILPELMYLVETLLFPYLCYNEEDEAAFVDDCNLSEFVQYLMEEGFCHGEVSARVAASNAILAMVKGNKSFHEDQLQKIIEALTIGLSREDNDETFRQTFGFLHLLSIIKKHLRKVPEIWGAQMVQVLVAYVAPRTMPTVNSVPLRCKAILVCERYSKVPIDSEEQFASFVQLVCNLVQDKDSRVRLGALNAISTFLEMKRALPYIRPIILPLVEECISFLNKVHTTFIPNLLLYIVDHFAPELSTTLGRIGSTLAQNFLAIAFEMEQQENMANDNEGIESYWQADMSACALLDALDTIVQASSRNKSAFESMRPDLLRLTKRVLEQPDQFSFMEKTLSILLHVTHFSKPITSDAWDLLPILFNSIDSGIGVDFFSNIAEVLDNYVSDRTVDYLQNTHLMEATYQVCEKMLFSSVCDMSDRIAVSQLIEAMLHQAKHCVAATGLFDAYIHRFVSLLLRALADDTIRGDGVQLRVWIVAALMDAFYYDSAATLEIIFSYNAFQQFFEEFFRLFRGVMNLEGGVKKTKKLKRGENDDAEKVVACLSILTRKVIVLGLVSLLEYLTTASNANATTFIHGSVNPSINLSTFSTYLHPTLILIQHCIFQNNLLLASRCIISQENLEKIRQGGVEVEDAVDVDLEYEDLLGIDDDDGVYDVVTEDDDDDNDDDNDNELGRHEDEGDSYSSPIDDVCEVTLFLKWIERAMSSHGDLVQQHVQSALSKSLEEFRAAEATALQYRFLVQQLDSAMENEYASRSAAALASA